MLASGDVSQRQLATRYGVSHVGIQEFARRHSGEIDRCRERAEDRFAALWISSKLNRLAIYQEQVEDVLEMLADGARVSVPVAELMRTAQTALRAVADELGQIPRGCRSSTAAPWRCASTG